MATEPIENSPNTPSSEALPSEEMLTFLPRDPIPFDSLRDEVGRMGLREQTGAATSDELFITDGSASLRARRSRDGYSIFAMAGTNREKLLETIGLRFGTTFVCEGEEEFPTIAEAQNRPHFVRYRTWHSGVNCRQLFDRRHVEGLDFRGLIDGAGLILQQLHSDRLFLLHPLALNEATDQREAGNDADALMQLEEVLGVRLLGDFGGKLELVFAQFTGSSRRKKPHRRLLRQRGAGAGAGQGLVLERPMDRAPRGRMPRRRGLSTSGQELAG